ncbi:hypothetical protein B0H13DRAFT_1902412, partial [Mycena leptocephala]
MTSALKLYEKAASAEREAMARMILPGREPPSAGLLAPPPVVPSASDSQQLLATHPDAIRDPNKTLVTVSATGIIGDLRTDERNEQRAQDADTAPKLKEVACTQLDATLKDAVLTNLSKESIPSSKPADRMIGNRYWLCRLADAAQEPAADNSLVIDYFPSPAEKLPEQEQHGYNKTRKYDAALRPSAAKVSTILNIFVNVEFTKTDAPTITYNPLIGADQHEAKYQQAIINADDLLTFQPTRLFVPTLSFHGKGENVKLFVSILSQERLEFAVVDNCFNSVNFPTVSALLHLFRIASLYQLGYNPLFTYNFSSPPPNFSVGDAVPVPSFFLALRSSPPQREAPVAAAFDAFPTLD